MTEGERPPEEEEALRILRTVRFRLRVGAALAGAGVAVLLLVAELPLLDAVGLGAFYLLLPAMALAQVPLIEGERFERIPVYVGSIVSILVLGACGGVLAARLTGVAPAGFTALPTGELLLWTGGLTVAGLLVTGAFHLVERRIGADRSDLMRRLLPRDRRERGIFAGLSFAAGVGEELAYRAYAFQAIQLLGPGPWAAAALASVPFGLLHAYQGPIGIVRTGAMGLVLAVPVVVTGSLLPSMAAHTLVDLLLGIVIGPRLLAEDEAGEGSPPDGSGDGGAGGGGRPRPDGPDGEEEGPARASSAHGGLVPPAVWS